MSRLKNLYLCVRTYAKGYGFIAKNDNIVYGINDKGVYCFWVIRGLKLVELVSFNDKVEAEFYFRTMIVG